MSKAICKAIARHGRIELLIKKGESGYREFAEVMNKIADKGFMSWYGDVVDENGKERSGLVITSALLGK